MIPILAHVFRSYDIRGIAQTEITPAFSRLIGRGFGAELRERYGTDHPTVIVGRDARTHSPELEQALTAGLVASGCIVKMIGRTPSPVNYFALCHFGCDGSVQITASHNPKEDNGLKLQLRDAEAFAGEDLQVLRKRIEEERFLDGTGSVEEIDAITPYLEKMEKIGDAVAYSDALDDTGAAVPRGCLIIADFGNGVAGPVYAEALRRAGYDLLSLYEEPDGTFPNHPADPSKHETLNDLIATVKEKKAVCGIAFDGDGDRVGFVDENGTIISPDYLLLLLAEDHLLRNPQSPVVYTVSMSGILETEIKRMGGNPIMCAVGHSFVEHAMREHQSHLGGEQSGHLFCGEDYYDYDDALVATLRILGIFVARDSLTCDSNTQINELTNDQASFSSLFTSFPRVYQSPEFRPHCPDEKKTEIVQRVTEYFQKEGYACNTLDGVRIDFGDGAWAGIRQSNTSPKLSICMEARSKENLDRISQIVFRHLLLYPEIESAGFPAQQ